MILSEISINRPVLATVMSLLIILLGLICFDRLSVREYPKIDPPTVSVRTVYKGATAEIVESVITTPIEDALSGIEGIKTIKSQSREEVSKITVTFNIKRDVDSAANDVRDRVSRVKVLLPQQADDPVVRKIEADAWPVMWIAVTSDRHTPMELSDYCDRYLVDPIKTVPGVATVIIGGERKYAMRIWLDRERLAGFGLSAQDIERALYQQNLDSPGGRIESSQRELTVLAQTDLGSPEAFNNMIIKEAEGYPIRLRDVGYAVPGPFENRKIVRVRGDEAIGLGVVKQSTGNTLEIAKGVRELVPKLVEGLPDGMSAYVVVDNSEFIDASIIAVFKVLLEALVLVMLVIFVFLRNIRASFIPAVTIPVSLIGSFIFLYSMGFSVNVLTLLGIVLAVGLVVDDAIVMLENIHRQIEGGENPFQAALAGSREIGFAVMAMTITLVAVFAPLVFMSGRVGQLFIEFALTVAAAVLVSGFVALTLTPMMCSRLLKEDGNRSSFYRKSENFFLWLNRSYRSALKGALKVSGLIVLMFFLIFAGMTWLFLELKSELSPVEDRGVFMAFAVAPEGSTMQYTDRYMKTIGQMINQIPEVDTLFEVVAPGLDRPNPVNFAIGFAVLKHWSKRTRKQMEITKELTPKLFGGLPGVISFSVNPPSLGASFLSKQVEYVIYGTSYSELQNHVNSILGKMAQYPGINGLDTDLKLNKPQLKVNVDRDKAATLGVSMENIGNTLEILLGGRNVTRYKREGKQYDVVVQMEDGDRRQPTDLTSIYVRSGNGDLVQLSNIVSLEEAVAPKELNHFNKFRAATITGNVSPGFSLGDVLDKLDAVSEEVLPPGIITDLNGQSREFRETGMDMYITLVLALVFIYLVLAAQFESFVGPFVIMLTVPLAFTGALLAMYINSKMGGGGSLNVYTRIGLVMLVGLITKHGILIVEFANQLRRRGLPKYQAIVEACSLRLRPILMTTFATVLGALPLALSVDAGAEARQAIGWVIVGGMALGTLLTLFIIPVFYSLIVRQVPNVGNQGGNSSLSTASEAR